MHELKQVETESEWSAYHAIREDVLWKARGRSEAYNRFHPADRTPGNFPMLLIYDGAPIGVFRVDVQSEVAWFRRVAIREGVQRQGHGREMMRLAMAFAREKGCHIARSNVDKAALGFYRKLGFSEVESEHSDGGVPMARDL